MSRVFAFDGEEALVHIVDEPWGWPPDTIRTRCGAWVFRKATKADVRRHPMCPKCALLPRTN